MKEWSIKTKLISLSGFYLAGIFIIGSMGIFGSIKLVNNLDEVASTQLPAIRNMTLIDMMHEGFLAVAYRAFYVSQTANEAEKLELAEELKEMSLNLNEYVGNIESLKLPTETKTLINESKPAIKNYISATEEIVALALAGRKDLADQKVSTFQKAFSDLEEKLEVLGDKIEKDSQTTLHFGQSTALQIGIAVAISFLIGLFASVFIISSLVRSLTATIIELSTSAKAMSESSVQIAANSQALSQSTTEQSASLEETAASLEQITAMVTKATENAQQMANMSTQSQEKAESGKLVVDQMISSMDEINQSNESIMNQVDASNQQMYEIVKVIQEIGNKTKVINDIVFQTKLLSFNASVEAARAGEHGKGFAVVAEEVGNLAQMSGNAAKEISDMLNSSITNVQSIVQDTKTKVEQLIKAGKHKVESGVVVARECAEVLSEIIQNVEKVSVLAKEVSSANQEQALGIREISKAMNQLDTVTQQNSGTSEQAAHAASSLSDLSMNLSKSVEALVNTIDGKSKNSNDLAPENSGAEFEEHMAA